MPSESELGERFSVSRIIIGRAVQELVDAGYLIKRPGKAHSCVTRAAICTS
ncbi:GntR family transcriptional regulator [Olsenella sp. Marseille-P4559]|uniref:GntR family transcriptional regulator n=1 Tax=Olsenella sp. Marseille-P4559 TaxID=2364795 RepID=UPI0013EF01E9